MCARHNNNTCMCVKVNFLLFQHKFSKMDRGKLLVSLALNQAQRDKIQQFREISRLPIKRRKSDVDYQPSSSESSSSDFQCLDDSVAAESCTKRSGK